MSKNAKTSVLLVLCLLLTVFVPHSSANDGHEVNQIVTFDQVDGLHVHSTLNLSGDSTVPLASVEIELWNISAPDQWSLLFSNPFLDNVVPYTDVDSDSTMWSWTHMFDLTSIDCTCYVEISLLEQTDLTSYGLLIYAGEDNHRPILRPSVSTESQTLSSTQIFSENMIDVSFDFVLPPSPENFGVTNLDVIPVARYCPAPLGICVENYSSLTTNYTVEEGLHLSIDANENQLDDGYYMFQIQIQDPFLTLSNNLTQYIVLDQTQPMVELTAIEEVNESEIVVVDVAAFDGYTGSRFVITWTITEPGETPRSVTEAETLQDNRLEFEAKKSGMYTVTALVRDLGGHLVVVEHDVSVMNQQPTAVVRFDGFQIFNDSVVTIPSDGNWVFSANDSTDTENDQESLEYYWYVDGKSLLSGKSYLESSDIRLSSYRTIHVEVVDDDGASNELSFEVVQQDPEPKDSLANLPLNSILTLFFVLFLGLLYVLRKRTQSDVNSGFVKWTERGKKSKN